MSGLHELQRRMAAAVMQPLTQAENMRQRSTSGHDNHREASEFIKPNDRLNSFERLEIYNRQYWFRLFSSFEEDFPGVQAIVGHRQFQRLMRAYLEECPSTSFSLRNLGSRLVEWLQRNPQWTTPGEQLVIDMAALEWAHIEAFDGAAWPVLTAEELAVVNEESRFALQPYLRLVHAHYAVDDALITVRNESGSSNSSSNNASVEHRSKRRRMLRDLPQEEIYLVVHRHEDTVYYRRLIPEDFRLLNALQEGATLSEAIDRAFEASQIAENEQPTHLQSFFRYCTAMGWLCAPSTDSEGAA